MTTSPIAIAPVPDSEVILLCAESPTAESPVGGSDNVEPFASWYAEVRRPEIQQVGPYIGGSLFARAVPAKSAGPVAYPQPFLSLYGATAPASPGRAGRAEATADGHRDRTTAVTLDEYELISDQKGSDGGSTAGILMVMTDNLESDRDDAFNAWYDVTHVGDIVATGAYVRVRRYRRPGPADGGPRFLAIYETFWADPLAAHALVQARAPTMEMWPAIRAHQVANYRLVEPAPSTP